MNNYYNILLVKRNRNNNKYKSVDGLFSGEYHIADLLSLFRNTYIVIINANLEHDDSLVVDRKRLNEVFDIKNNKIKCQNCNRRYPLDYKYCDKCGFENEYFDITKYLSEDTVRQIDIKDRINEVWGRKGGY